VNPKGLGYFVVEMNKNPFAVLRMIFYSETASSPTNLLESHSSRKLATGGCIS